MGSSAHEQKLLDQAAKLQAAHPTQEEALVALKARADTIASSKYESKLSSWKYDDCKAIEELNETLEGSLASTATALEEKVGFVAPRIYLSTHPPPSPCLCSNAIDHVIAVLRPT